MIGTTWVIDALRQEGFEVSPTYVEWLLRERVIAAPQKGPGGVRIWQPQDVERLKSELIRRGRGPPARKGT